MTTAANDTKRRALGKGLDSLLPRVHTAATPVSTAIDAEGGKPREIPLEQIDPNPFQTRSQMNEEQLAELAASITANGVVQPILVRPQTNGRFQLIAGERRWRASQMVGKETIPAILRQVSDEQAMEITIVENLQRADLNPMEQARAFDRLSREFHMTQEQMAVRTGKDRVTVANFMRLLKLPESIQTRVEAGELSFGHARALLGLSHHPGDRKGCPTCGRHFRFLFAKLKPTCKTFSTLSAIRRSPNPRRPSIPTCARWRSGCNVRLASRSTSRTRKAAEKSSSSTPT